MTPTETLARKAVPVVFEGYINKLRFVFGGVKVVFNYGAIDR